MGLSNLLNAIAVISLIGFFLYGAVVMINEDQNQNMLQHCAENAGECAKGITMYTYAEGAINPPYFQNDWLEPFNQTMSFGNQTTQVYTPILEDGFSFDSLDLILIIPLILLLFWILNKTQLGIGWKILIFFLFVILLLISVKYAQYHVMIEGGNKLGWTEDETRAFRQLKVDTMTENNLAMPLIILGLISSIAIGRAVLGFFRNKG